MGKHIKTSMDEKVIAYLAIEVHRLDPDNETLNKFRSMLTDTGYEKIALNFADIRNKLAEQRQIILSYQDYYEPKE